MNTKRLFKEWPPMATSIILALALVGYSFWQVNFNRAGWGDEFAFIDIAANYLTFGEWKAYNFMDVTWSLYVWLAVPWLAVFGIGHVAACSLNIVCLFFSLLTLTWFLLRRDIIKSHLGVAVFYFALWSNVNFMWTVASGRYDMCALFFSILLAERLSAPDTQCETRTRWLLAICMFLLMKTMLYTIPLLGFYGIMLLVFPPSGVARAAIFKRGMCCAGGAALGFAANMAYNFSQHHLLYYFYNLFIHNAVVSGHLEGSAETFPGCYLSEPAIIAIIALAFAITFATGKIKRLSVPHVVFVCLIPFLMIVAGRYAFYYHFIWLVPAAVFFAWASEQMEPIIARLGVVAVLCGSCGFTSIKWIVEHIERPFVAEQDKFVEFMTANSDKYVRGEPLILFEEEYYYPAYSLGLQPWRRRELDSLRYTTQSRIDGLLASRISNSKLRQMVLDFYNNHEKLPCQKLPDGGLLIVKSEEQRAAFEDVLRWQNYNVSVVASEGDLTLLRIEKACAYR